MSVLFMVVEKGGVKARSLLPVWNLQETLAHPSEDQALLSGHCPAGVNSGSVLQPVYLSLCGPHLPLLPA